MQKKQQKIFENRPSFLFLYGKKIRGKYIVTHLKLEKIIDTKAYFAPN